MESRPWRSIQTCEPSSRHHRSAQKCCGFKETRKTKEINQAEGHTNDRSQGLRQELGRNTNEILQAYDTISTEFESYARSLSYKRKFNRWISESCVRAYTLVSLILIWMPVKVLLKPPPSCATYIDHFYVTQRSKFIQDPVTTTPATEKTELFL